MGSEEIVDVLHAGRIKVGHGTDGRVMVRVTLGEDRGVDVDQGVAIGHVVVTLPLLLLDHVALVVEVLLVDRVQQPAVPVRLQPQGQIHRAARNRLEVVRAIKPGGGVQTPAH